MRGGLVPQREVDEMPRCESCGILIPVQELLKQHDGHDVIVCSEKCFRIYTTYVYPRYGHWSERGAAGSGDGV